MRETILLIKLLILKDQILAEIIYTLHCENEMIETNISAQESYNLSIQSDQPLKKLKEDVELLKKSFIENWEEIEKLSNKIENLENNTKLIKTETETKLGETIDIVIKELDRLNEGLGNLETVQINDENRRERFNEAFNNIINELKDRMNVLSQESNEKFRHLESKIAQIKTDLIRVSSPRSYKNFDQFARSLPQLHVCKSKSETGSPIKIRLTKDEAEMQEEEGLKEIDDMYMKLQMQNVQLTRPSILKSTEEASFNYPIFVEKEHAELEKEINIKDLKEIDINKIVKNEKESPSVPTKKSPLEDLIENLEEETKIPTVSNVFSLLFLTDFSEGELLISGHKDGKINIWSLDTPPFTLFKFYSEHKDYVDDLKSISPSLFISCSKDQTIKLWDVHSNFSIRTFFNNAWTYCIAPLKNFRNDLFATGDEKNNIKIWDITEDKDDLSGENKLSTNTSQIKSGHLNGISRILFLSDVTPCKFLLTSSFSEIKLWDLETFKLIRSYTEHTDWINGLVYLHSNLFCSACGDKTIRVWDIYSNVAVKTIRVHNSYVACLVNLPTKELIGINLIEDGIKSLIVTGSLGNSSKIVQWEYNKQNLDEEGRDHTSIPLIKKNYYRDEPIFKMELIPIRYYYPGPIKNDFNPCWRIAGCYFGSRNIKIWGKKKLKMPEHDIQPM